MSAVYDLVTSAGNSQGQQSLWISECYHSQWFLIPQQLLVIDCHLPRSARPSAFPELIKPFADDGEPEDVDS